MFIVAPIVTNGEDRNMTRTQNCFRDAANHMPARATRPVRPHYDEIRFECLGRLHEGGMLAPCASIICVMQDTPPRSHKSA